MKSGENNPGDVTVMSPGLPQPVVRERFLFILVRFER